MYFVQRKHYRLSNLKGVILYDKQIFPEEQITENDLYFLCYMIERIARKLHQKNKYVVNSIAKDEWERLISLANVLHCENPLKIEDEWIEEYKLVIGNFDITNVDSELGRRDSIRNTDGESIYKADSVNVTAGGRLY